MNTELILQSGLASLRYGAGTDKVSSKAALEKPKPYEAQLLPTGSLFDCVGVVLDLSLTVEATQTETQAGTSTMSNPFQPALTYSKNGAASVLTPPVDAPAAGTAGQHLDLAA